MSTSCEIVRLIQVFSKIKIARSETWGKFRGGAIAHWAYSMEDEWLQSCARLIVDSGWEAARPPTAAFPVQEFEDDNQVQRDRKFTSNLSSSEGQNAWEAKIRLF